LPFPFASATKTKTPKDKKKLDLVDYVKRTNVAKLKLTYTPNFIGA
jgi:hypothetical protein